MFLLEFIWDILDGGYRWWHAVAHAIPRTKLPPVDDALEWLEDRLDDIATAFRKLRDAVDDIGEWFDLVHDIALRVIGILDIEEWLKRLWDLHDLTLGDIVRKIADGLRWAFTVSEEFADDFVDALLPALKRALTFIDLAGDAFGWAVIHVIDEVFKPGIGLFEDIIEDVWKGISSVGGPLLDWLIDNADWFYDTLLNIPTRIAFHIAANAKDFIELILDLPEWLLNEILEAADWTKELTTQGLNALLDIIVNKSLDFVTAVTTGITSHLDDVAQPIIDLGETILDYVWGED